jgi:tRNA/tmRNA/rRNA uracil-C5-methylase (TrmA/RlmC/RlmD family)
MALNIGDRLTLHIHDIAFGGEGVGRVQLPAADAAPAGDFVLFVPFVLPGEEVEVEVTEVKRNFARARLLRVLQPSPERAEPACPHFTRCGGCQYQHINYPEQLRIKHKQVADLFERIGKISPDSVMPVVPCPQPYGYRNRIMIRSQWNKPEQKLNIGFLRGDCGLVEDIQECKIAEPALNEQILHVRANPPPKGGIKVVLRVQPEGWDVARDSFFQNNFFLLPQLVETARACLKASGVKHLLDLYCGVGFFGIELADAVESFAGVEYDAAAIKSARKNAAARKVANGEFVAGMVEQVMPGLLEKFPAAQTAVLIDPPRKGCWPQALELLRAMRPAQVIYISCHPATMARDLNILCNDGTFRLAQVTPLDMFPQTQHVECVADLRGT